VTGLRPFDQGFDAALRRAKRSVDRRITNAKVVTSLGAW
jgi:hypothetical protein